VGLYESDFDLLGRSMVDLFAEPIVLNLFPVTMLFNKLLWTTALSGVAFRDQGRLFSPYQILLKS
jgi:hypothetical protein